MDFQTTQMDNEKIQIFTDFSKSIETKNKLYRKMCQTKNTFKREKLVNKVKTYKKYILNLTRKSKANHFNNFFQENKLNLFKTWEGIKLST